MASRFTLLELKRAPAGTPAAHVAGTIFAPRTFEPKVFRNGDSIQNFFLRDRDGTEIKCGVWSRKAAPFPHDIRDYHKGFLEVSSNDETSAVWTPTDDPAKCKLEISLAGATIKLLRQNELRDGLPVTVKANGPAESPNGTTPATPPEALAFPPQTRKTELNSRASLDQIAGLLEACLARAIVIIRAAQEDEARQRQALSVGAMALTEINFNPLLVATYEQLSSTAIAEGLYLQKEAPAAPALTAIDRLGELIGPREAKANEFLEVIGALAPGTAWRNLSEEQAAAILKEGKLQRLLAS